MTRKVLMVSRRKRAELKKRFDEKLKETKRAHHEAMTSSLGGKNYDLRHVKPVKTEIKKVTRSDHREIGSLVTNKSSTTKKEQLKYTGDKLLGIGLMHKSNYVPIMKQEDAEAVTKMRR